MHYSLEWCRPKGPSTYLYICHILSKNVTRITTIPKPLNPKRSGRVFARVGLVSSVGCAFGDGPPCPSTAPRHVVMIWRSSLASDILQSSIVLSAGVAATVASMAWRTAPWAPSPLRPKPFWEALMCSVQRSCRGRQVSGHFGLRPAVPG